MLFASNLIVDFTCESYMFLQSFVDYSVPTYFNHISTLFKKKIHGGLVNGEKEVY